MARKPLEPSEWLNRENNILRVARQLFLSRGIDGLTMERLAAGIEYSRGTVYNHFASKEDVLAALCIQTWGIRHGLLARAALFKGLSRERALAAAQAEYLVYRLYPDYWRVEQFAEAFLLTSKIAPKRQAVLDASIERSAGIALGIIRNGVSSSELRLPAGITSGKLLMALSGLLRGLYLINPDNTLINRPTSDLTSTQYQLFSCTCDGFGWHPFTGDWNYAETVQRIWREAFPAEAAQLGLSITPARIC